MTRLTATRKADREKMAQMLIEAATKAGASANIDAEWGKACPRAIMVRIDAPGGAYIGVHFNGDCVDPDVYVMTWNVRHDPEFEGVRFGDIGAVNAFHRRKATRVAEGIKNVIDMLTRDIRRFVDGSGYERPAQAEAA